MIEYNYSAATVGDDSGRQLRQLFRDEGKLFEMIIYVRLMMKMMTTTTTVNLCDGANAVIVTTVFIVIYVSVYAVLVVVGGCVFLTFIDIVLQRPIVVLFEISHR
eukprot:m.113601 g.113601  ORF g.113601 m.113601 type:complete len:105 (+) comp28283_c2_seq1:350-664(+)